MHLLQPRRVFAAGLLAVSVAMLGFSSDSRAEESSLTPEVEKELMALVAEYQGEPVFVPAGDPIDIKAALEGKLIYFTIHDCATIGLRNVDQINLHSCLVFFLPKFVKNTRHSRAMSAFFASLYINNPKPNSATLFNHHS